MADTKDLIVKLSLENARFKSELEKTKGKLSGLTGETKKQTGALTRLRGGYAILATVAAGAVGAVLSKMVKLSAEFEQTKVAFTTFLGSAERADKILQQLQDFSVVTPFTIGQVNRAAKTLLAFGVAGEDVQDTLKLIGDVSAGTGKDLTQMAVIFGKIKGNGKLMGAELNMLIDGGFNPLNEISKNTGKSFSELKDEMARGNISFDMVSEAFKTATSEGGLFNDMMAKQSLTLNGRISTLQGNVELLAVKFGDKLAPMVGSVVDQLNSLVGWLGKSGNEFDKEKEKLVASQDEFNIRINMLKDAGMAEGKRKKILGEVNETLKTLGVQELTQASNLSAIEKARTAANAAFLQEISLAAQKAEFADIEEKAVALRRKEWDLSKKIAVWTEKARKETNSGGEELGGGAAAVADGLKLERDAIKAKIEALAEERDAIMELAGVKELLLERDKENTENRIEEDTRETETVINNDEKEKESAKALADARIAEEDRVRQFKANTAKQIIDIAGTTSGWIRRYAKDDEESQKKAAVAGFIINKIAAVAKSIIATRLAVANAIALPALLPGIRTARVTAARVAGGLNTAAILATPPPKFATGGIINDVAMSSSTPMGEDGLIAVQRGESVLNRSATTELGESTINALNNLGGTTVNNTNNVADGQGAVEVINEFLKTQGGSRGAGI